MKKKINDKKKSTGRKNNDAISVPRLVSTRCWTHDIRSFAGQRQLPVTACMIKRNYNLTFPVSP